jgi:hypothetical protein
VIKGQQIVRPFASASPEVIAEGTQIPGTPAAGVLPSEYPGYDADATPAKEPKDVVLSVGPACA